MKDKKYYIPQHVYEQNLRGKIKNLTKNYDSILSIEIGKQSFVIKKFLWFKTTNEKTVVRITVDKSIYVFDLLQDLPEIEKLVRGVLIGELLEVIYQ